MKRIVFVLLLALLCNVTFAGPEQDGDIKYPEKRHSLKLWEHLLNLPGYAVLMPVWTLDYALVPVSYAITETKIIEKTVDLLNSDDGMRGVFPVYDSRVGAGMTYYHRNLVTDGSVMFLTATAWGGNRRSVQMNVNNIKLAGPVKSEFSLKYFNYTDEPFYGIGNNVPKANKAAYTLEQFSGDFTLKLPVNPRNAFSASVGYEQNKVSDQDEAEELSLLQSYNLNTGSLLYNSGLFDNVRLLSGRLQFLHDSRDAVGNPSKGWELLLRGELYKQTDGSEYGFYRGIADVSKYFHLFYNRTLVFRAAGQITTSYDNGLTPFYYLSELGHRETIRGYQRGRFMEKDKVLGSVEYRFPILKRYRPGREAGSIDMVLFMDSGKVSPDISDNFSDGFHNTYGFGFRIYNSRALMMQFYSGYSDDGVRLYFVLN